MSLVLFDIDGTLLRNAGAHHKDALIAGIRQVTGLSTTLDGVPTSGMLDRDLIAGMLRASGASRKLTRSALPDIMSACQACYHANCAADLRDRICPGVVDCLRGLHSRRVAVGVVTGNLSAIGWKTLELAGLREYFSVGAFAEDGATRARLARLAARRAAQTGLISKGARISLVGDHSNDINAAKANGFQAVGVATGLMPYEELRLAGPDVLVRNMTELEISQLI
jgi:phosphoglycolate phosphatase